MPDGTCSRGNAEWHVPMWRGRFPKLMEKPPSESPARRSGTPRWPWLTRYGCLNGSRISYGLLRTFWDRSSRRNFPRSSFPAISETGRRLERRLQRGEADSTLLSRHQRTPGLPPSCIAFGQAGASSRTRGKSRFFRSLAPSGAVNSSELRWISGPPGMRSPQHFWTDQPRLRPACSITSCARVCQWSPYGRYGRIRTPRRRNTL